MYVNNILEPIIKSLIIVTFILLISLYLYLNKLDDFDVLRARLFLSKRLYKNYFLIVLFAFTLVLHGFISYLAKFFNEHLFGFSLIELHRFLGLILVIILIFWAYNFLKSIQ